jgi:hypothetical protein
VTALLDAADIIAAKGQAFASTPNSHNAAAAAAAAAAFEADDRRWAGGS